MSNDSTTYIVEILPPLVLGTVKSILAISMAFHAVSLFMSDGSSTVCVCYGDTNDISVAVLVEFEATTVDSSWLKVAITMFRSFVVMAAIPMFAALVPSHRRKCFAHLCRRDALQA